MSNNHREIDMCCGTIADKGKLLAEYAMMEKIIEDQRTQLEKLHKEVVQLRRRLNKGECGAN